MFADIIRSAKTEQEIYFLVTSYIESVRYGDKLHCMSEHITRLPLNGVADIRERFEHLMMELDAASKRLDDNSCTVIREGVHILGSALDRLGVIELQQSRPQARATAEFDARAA